MEKYNLSIVGVTHPVQPQIYGQFPCVISCMIRTREFPHDPLFLTEYPRNRKLSPRDQALRKLFPNPSLRPNVGWRLWHWNYQKKGKWLSFGEKDHFYVTEVNYHNLQDIPLPEQKLLYHEKSGTLSVRLKCKGKYKLVNVAKNSKFINFKKMYRENNV
jgi:hypothetical protein